MYNTTLLPDVNTIALEMFCGARFAHHTFTPVMKHHSTTTTTNVGVKNAIDKLIHEKSNQHQKMSRNGFCTLHRQKPNSNSVRKTKPQRKYRGLKGYPRRQEEGKPVF